MYITEMDKIGHILEQARAAGLTEEDIIKEYIDDWQQSRKLALMLDGERYYNNDNDIKQRKRQVIGEDGKLVEDKTLTNTKLAHAFVRKLVDQKTQYLFGLPLSIQCKNETYATLLSQYFDEPMQRRLKNLCKEAVNKGVGWMQVYINGAGELCFKKIPSEQVIPVWTDDDRDELAAVIRCYLVEVYAGKTKELELKVEYWTTQGVKYYTLYNGRLLPDVERQDSAHMTVGSQPMNFTKVPWVYFRYNEEEQPLLQFVQPLIDDYDLLSSDDSNNILDSPNAILVIKGYGAESLGKFRKNLATYRAFKVDGDRDVDGGVDVLDVPIHTAEVQTHLQQVRKDLYETGRGVDTQSDKLGNASGVALKFVYADLDLDCNGIETEFLSSFRRMRFFIDTYLQLTGQGDYSGETVDFVLNRDIIISETEAIASCRDSVGIISNKTIVANHPFVTDLEAELKQLESERQELLVEDGYGQPPGQEDAGDEE